MVTTNDAFAKILSVKSLAVRDTMHQKGNYVKKSLKTGNEMKASSST
jgi:hypothetical protein